MTCGRELGYTCSDNPKLKDPGCGEHFGSLRAFDRHHTTGERQVCLSRAQMRARGFRLKPNGVWTVDRPMAEPVQASFGLRRGRPAKAQRKIRGRARARRAVENTESRAVAFPGQSEADAEANP